MLRLLPLVLLAGCLDNTPPALAPEEIDENLRWFWINGDSATDATLGIMFYTVLALILSGAVGTLAEPWVAAPHDSIWLILLCGALQAIAHWMQIEAYRCAEVSLLMPFRYISLVFATALGFAVFGDVPTWNVAVGSCVIIGSGLFIWHRERQVRRRAAAAAT